MVHENLEKLRRAKGVTKTHLAKVLKVSSMTYGRIESGESKLDVERLRDLSKALNIKIEVFFDDELTENVISEFGIENKVV